MVGPGGRSSQGRRTRDRSGPLGTGVAGDFGYARPHVREDLRRWGSPPDRGRDGPRLGALARRGAPADRRARGGPHGRSLRRAGRPDAGRPVDPGLPHGRDHARGASGPRRPAHRPRSARSPDPRGPPSADPRHRRRPTIGGVPPEPPADDVAPRGSDHRARDRVRQHLPHRQAGRRDVRRGGRTRPRGPRDPGGDRGRERPPVRRDRAQGQGAPAAAGARGAGADREGAPRRRDPIAVRRRHEPPGARVVIGRRGGRAAPRGGRRGCRRRDPGPAQLHLRSAARDPRRPAARPGAQGDGERVRQPAPAS